MKNEIEGVAFFEVDGYQRTEVRVCQTIATNLKAEFSRDMVERWGMCAAIPDGEDSTGRQKLRLATPDELVSRACETAEKLFAAFRQRNWLLDLPVPKVKLGDNDDGDIDRTCDDNK